MSDHPEPATTERGATVTSLLIGLLLAGCAVVSAVKFAEYPLSVALVLDDTAHERRMIRWQVIDSVVLGPAFWHVTGKVRGLHIPASLYDG